jgi:polar amino acid transport system substrate-binding protein
MSWSKPVIALLLSCCFSFAANSEPIAIRTASQDGFPAKYSLGNKARLGICVEIIQALEKTDPDLRFTGLEGKAVTARIEAMIVGREIDAFCGMAKLPEREAKYTFLEPALYSSSQYLFVKADDTISVNSFEDVKKLGKDGTILVIRGTTQEKYLESMGGLVIDNSSTDTIQNLKKLEAGRGRFYYGSDLNTFEDINSLGLKGKIKALPAKYQPAGIYFIVNKQTDPKIVSRIDAGLKKLHASGEMAKLFKKYTD